MVRIAPSRTLRRFQRAFAILTVLSQFVLLGGPAIQVAHADTPAGTPTLSTDKADYAPTDLVTITGAGFVSGADVTLNIIGGTTSTDDFIAATAAVTPDASGAFTYGYQLDGTYRPNYTVTATDSDGVQLAQVSFTDSGSIAMWNQCENNKTGTIGNCGWTSGNLTAAHNSLFEGMATHQEVVVTGLSTGAHTLRFGVETTKSGNHAYDWIVSDAQAIQAAAEDGITTTLNPCTGGSSSNNATCNTLNAQTGSNHVTPSVPDDSFVSADGSTQTRINGYETHFGNRIIDLYSDQPISGATLTLEGHCSNKTGASCNTIANGGDTGDTFLWYSLSWTSNGTAALMRTAADIALGGDGTGRSWGAGRGATGVSGSPYHFYLNTIDGSGGSLDNQMAAGAVFTPPVTPTVTTQVQNASNVDITNQSVVIGTVVHDHATVDTGSASTTIPTGSTFTFHRYNTIDCTGTPTDQAGVAVPSGAQTGSANSSTFTPVAPGNYSYKADFISGGGSVTNATGICEPFTVAKASPTISTTPSAGGAIGTTLNDTATLSGGASPTGSVTFTLYPPSDATCSGAASYTNTDTTAPYATTPGFVSNAVGTWHWKAHYAGDASNNPADSLCADEAVIIGQGTSSVATTLHQDNETVVTVGGSVPLGTIMHDSATVTVSDGVAPTGSVDFRFYLSLAACTADTSFSAGTLSSHTLNGANPGVAHPSASTSALSAGTYAFKAKWAGDTNYTGNTSGCENFTVNQGTTSVTTELHKANETVVAVGGHVALGTIMHDKATVTVSGSPAPTGSVTFTLYPSNNCTGGGTAMGTVALDGANPGVAHPSNSTSALAAGDYSFKASWPGDTNYPTGDSSCENFTVDQAQLGITTNVHDAAHVDKTNGTVPLGSVLHDTATVTGGVSGFALPAVSFTMTSGYTGTCAAGAAVGIDGIDAGNGATKSADSAALGAGDYAYRAVVAGNSNYIGATSVCEPVTVNKAQLSVTTAVHDAAHTNVTNGTLALGSVTHDTATVTGGVQGFAVPTPTFTMTTGYTNDCSSGTPVTNTGFDEVNVLDYRSAGSGALGAGTYAYRGSVAGNANYLGSDSTCEPFTVNKAQLTVDTTVHDAAHQNQTNQSVPLGSVMHDTATVSGGVGGFTVPTPTFTMTTGYTNDCSAGSVVANNGTEGSAAKSADSAALAAGHYAYQGSVAGNANYFGGTSVCEPFTVSKADLSISTELHNASEGVVAVGSSVPVNTTMHDKATVTGINPSFSPAHNVQFTYFTNGTCNTGTPAGSVALDGSGIAHPSDSKGPLAAGMYSFSASIAGDSNYNGNASTCENFTVVDARISVTPLTATNEVTHAHVITATVQQNLGDGAGFVNAPDGTGVTFSLLNNTAGATFVGGINTCTTTSGTCSVSINTSTAGGADIQATTTFSVNSVSLTRTTGDGLSGDSGNAHKDYVDARITLSPLTATNKVNDAHVITARVQQNTGSGFVDAPDGTLVTFSLLNNTAGATFVGGNTCTTTSGTCTVSINTGTAGNVDIHATTTFSVSGVSLTRATGDGLSGDSANANKTYVDLRITIDANSTNEVNHSHIFTVTVQSNPGTGSFGPVSGATVTPGITGVGSLTGTGTCQTGTTDGSGHCTIIVNSATTGVGTVSATTTVSVGGVSITRSLGDGLSGDSEKATKTWVDTNLTVSPLKATNEVNHEHVITATVQQDLGNGAGFVTAPDGTLVTFSLLNNTAGAAFVGGINTCTTTAGTCSVSINTGSAGGVDIHATTTFTVSGVSITRTTGDGLSGDSDNAHKDYVDARISLNPLTATNKVNDHHVITATVQQNTGSGFVTAPDGTLVTFSLLNNTAGAAFVGGINTCTTTAGTCSVSINSSTTGTVDIHATTTFSVSGVSLTRASGDGLSGDSANANKTYVDLKITIDQSSTNEVNHSHTFTVTVQSDPGTGTFGPVAGAIVTPGITGAGSLTGTGSCQTGTTDGSGHCTIIVNSASTGIGTVSATTTVSVGGVPITRSLGDGLSGDSAKPTKTWVDANLALSPLTATNGVTHEHVITATVQQDLGDGSGFAAAPNGTLVTFSLLNNIAGATFVGGINTCTTTSGTCSVTINSSTPGTVDIHATTTFSVSGVSITRATGDGLSGDSANANKVYVDVTVSTVIHKDGDESTNYDLNAVTNGGNLPLGSSVHDKATVTPSSGNPGGTVTYSFYGNATCSGEPADLQLVPNGSESTSEGPLAAGDYSFLAHYNGDGPYPAKDAPCERLHVNQGTSQVTTHLYDETAAAALANGGNVAPGTTVHDSATVTVSNGFAPTGSVNFRFFPNSSCSNNGAGAGSATLSGNPGEAGPSTSMGPLSAGQYSFNASWAGDANYTGGTSTCEPFNVVDGSISLTPQEASNAINQPHTITALVTQNDGTGTTDVSGALVTFTVTTGSATFVGGVNTCTTDGTGTCSVQITSATTGNNVINATTTFDVNGVSLTRATDGNSGPLGSDAAEKEYVNARIRITPNTSTNEVGNPHTFTVTVEQDTGSGFVPVPAGTLANAIATPTPDGGLNVADCNDGVDALGQCTVTINSSVAGVFTITARSTVVVDGVTFKLQTNGLGSNSGPATKTYVNAAIALSPLTATNNITDPHTITATVTKDPGTGSVPAAGVLVTFSLLNNTAGADFVPTSGDNTCTTNVSGQCSVTINSATPGSVDIHATATFSIGGVSLTRASGDSHTGDSANANKVYQAGSLQVSKVVNLAGYPFPNSVDLDFTVTVTGPSYPSGTPVTFHVVNGVPTNSPQTLTPLIPGAYTVTESDPGVAWTVTGNGGVTVVANQTASATITNTLKQPHTTISITPNTFETAPGENVILTITDTNDGFVPLTNPSVTLTYGATTVTLDKTHFYVSGDTNNNGIMDVGEVWTWSYTAVISSDTTFTVAGHGLDPFGNDITPPTYPSEGASVTVKVVGTTRTLGFWQTHTDFTSWVFANKMGSSMPIGSAPHKGVLTNPAQIFGGFYAAIAKTSTGAKRDPVDQARITLLQQLLAAKLNCAAFGCSATTQSNIAAADAAYAAGNKTAIMNYVTILDTYNNSGDSGAIPSSLPATGKATPSASKTLANLTFWDNP